MAMLARIPTINTQVSISTIVQAQRFEGLKHAEDTMSEKIFHITAFKTTVHIETHVRRFRREHAHAISH
jgi:hypothetical protein